MVIINVFSEYDMEKTTKVNGTYWFAQVIDMN